MNSYIGKMLDGRYEILERIGTGGMAMVFKAKCHRLNRLVAIKILKSDLAQDADFRRRFHTESQAVALLSHPNIVAVYDVSKSDDLDYIVMELIDGITLKQYMERKGALSWREALHFITQILRGLDHAHSRGIVHRDIKPQNMMVLRDGSVKVTDFGIACMEDANQTLTQQQTFGSVHYISPEQAKGDRPDARSDIYSAGVMFYEMLCGRLPFEGDSAISIALQHVSSIPLSPREINPEVPQALELICLKAMAPVLSKRYQTAQEVVDDLEAFRKNPDMTVDIQVADLHTVKEDEPTVAIPASQVAAMSQAVKKKKVAIQEEDEHEFEEEYEHRGIGVLRVFLLLALLVAVVAGLVVFFKSIFASFITPVPEYSVPDLQGMTVAEALMLEEIDGVFEIVESETVISETFAEGEIITQDPVADAVKKSDTVIYVTVSAGEGTIEMLDLIGKNSRVAELELRDIMTELNITIETMLVFSDSVPADDLVETLPDKGTVLQEGDVITFYVSQGPEIETTTVPSFIGKDIADVELEIVEVWKLELGTTSYVEDEAPSGQVITQSVPVATEVNEGTAVDFVVSSGPGETAAGTTGSTTSGEQNTITINPQLPTDRVTVKLMVTLDDIPVYNQTVETSLGSVPIEVTGSGMGRITVYWDGLVLEEYMVQLS